MTRYINIFTREYRHYIDDFIRWCSYSSLEEAREEAINECPSNNRFKKTIIIETSDRSGETDFCDDFFEEIFPNTRHHYDGDVSYDIPN